MALITIENTTLKSLQILYEGELERANDFTYKEKESGASVSIHFDDDGISIIREADVKTSLHLYEKSKGEVLSIYGILPLEVERISYECLSHQIKVKYRISDFFIFTITF